MKKEHILVLLSLLAFLYCLARAAGLSMTHDESATVLEFASRPFWKVVTNDPPRANNHILNTLLIQFFSLFGNDKFLVRLPNVLAGGVFLFFTYRLVRTIASGWWESLLAFALLVFNPYLLEFFSLARGYGLSLGFLMGSLYFLHCFVEKRALPHLAWSMALAVLACYSNLAMLTYFIALALVVNLSLVLSAEPFDRRHWLKANGAILLFSLVLFALVFTPLRALVREGELYYGGTRGVLPNTFTTLVHNYLGGENYFGDPTQDLFLAPVFILLLLAISRNLVEGGRRGQFDTAVAATSLLLLMAFGNFLQHELLGTRYLIHRTALMYFPLMAVVIFFLFKGSADWLKLALLLPLAFHFTARANVKTVQEWWFERFTEDAFEYIAAQQPRDSTIRLGSFWLFTPTLNYYKQERGYTNIIGPNLDFEVPGNKYFDYYYLSTPDTVKLHPDYILVKSFGDYCIMKLPPDKKDIQ
ncbi:MAG: glycosyltransferase family 39 protein [Phaeodactylibacter sp.]|nr:glycosyltransferase family 39 protein [Phaeodactylibacter sp.]MCB9049928.1 glycosyltransferase family 39 protein [Lewinellaceae bacterium]